jgi:parallel beta-helix repeat protein
MSVNLSSVGGAAAQFFDNNGNILSGGKLYTYVAGSSTPQTTYTSSSGSTAHTNPIILDSAGRVPSGEIWLTVNATYKFLLADSSDVLIGTYDNIPASFATDSSLISYTPAGTGAVTTTVQAKLRQTVSVKDFGAVGDGVTNDYAAIQAAFNSTASGIYVPQGTYLIGSNTLTLPQNCLVYGDGGASIIVSSGGTLPICTLIGTSGNHKSNLILRNIKLKRTNGAANGSLVRLVYADDCVIEEVIFDGNDAAYPGVVVGESVLQLLVSGCSFIGGTSLNLTSEAALASNPWSKNCVVKNCYLAPAAHQGFDFYYVQNLIVDSCIAHGRTSTYGCGFIVEYQGVNITFTNCISYDNTRSGFYYEPNVSQGLASVTFNNCIAYGNGESGLYAQNSFGLVVNGGVYWGSLTTFTGSNAGIALEDVSQNCVITGAYIHSNQICGLRIAQGNGNTITGNIFYNNNGPAIYVTGTSIGQVITGNTFTSNISIISGWVENQTGTFSDYEWATGSAPIVYSNDGVTTVTVSNSSLKYKRIARQTCLIHGYFEFAGSALNNIIYIQVPFTVGWTGSTTGPDAKTMRGTAKGSASAVLPVASLYYNDRLSISGLTVSDTSVTFTATYEIA